MNNNELLVKAARSGDASEVQRLIPLSNPQHNHSCALRMAAENGYTECVKLLLPHSNAKAMNNMALRKATLRRHYDCIDVLCEVSDVAKTLYYLNHQHPKKPELVQYLECKFAEQQMIELNKELTQALENKGVSSIKGRKI